ncbi:MAG: D-2-hydroxyacid dehydrogenase [Nakamurella sp.]
MSHTIRVALATPLAPELRHLITDVHPTVELIVDDDLLPIQRFPGDHDGDPDYRRSAAQQDAFMQLVSSADVLYGIPDTDPALLAATVRANPRLRWVHTMAAGGGAQVRAAALTSEEMERVQFSTSAGVHGATLAEFALFGILAGAKDLPRLRTQQSHRQWSERWVMRQVHEMTVLVVGLGGIGKQTAALVKALGAQVVGVRQRVAPVDSVDEVYSVDELETLVGRADAIVFTLPGTEATDGIYGPHLIAATKPGAIIVNVGRGTVIDEPGLIAGLQSGHLASAFLDVFAVEPLPAESPLWAMPQVVIAPHTAGLSPHEDRRIARLFAENLRRFIAGDELVNLVDRHQFY